MIEKENVFSDAEIKDDEFNKLLIRNYSTRPNQKSAYGPGLTAEETKKLFDESAIHIKEKHNILVGALKAIGPAESERSKAELSRVQNEEERETVEQARKEAEDDRKAAENERKAAEESRRANDAVRDAKIESVQVLVGDIDSALDAIIAIQESLIGGNA